MKRKILRIYLVANEGKENETYFSVRASWVNWLKSTLGMVTNETILSKANTDDSSMLKIMQKDAFTMFAAV